MEKSINIFIRKIISEDVDDYEHWTHPSREHHKYNGPYFKQLSFLEHKEEIDSLRERIRLEESDALKNKEIIADVDTNEIIGCVNWYWKSKETNWLEVGIVIFNENYWGYGIGKKAMKQWIDKVFETKSDLVRIGLTTWSGNSRMMKLSEKLGLKKEAVYRNARIVNGEYYDSVSYGILKDEWDQL